MTTVIEQKPPRLKELPKGFINQFISDQLKEMNIKFLKRILPNKDGEIEKDKDNQMVDYIINCKDKYEYEQVLQMVETMMGNSFNRYIEKTLGNPKDYNRSISIFEYSVNDKNYMIKIHIRGNI